jgi:tetratricopeptide (TPR) repeat protein
MSAPTLKTAAGVGFVLLLLNTAYVWALASPTIFYMANVLAHLGLGFAVSVAGAALLAKECGLRRVLGPAAMAMSVALGFGVFLAIAGNTSDYHWALRAHIAAGLVATIAVLPYLRRLVRRGGRERAFASAAAVAACLVPAMPFGVAAYGKAHPRSTDRILNPAAVPLSMEEEGGGPGSPFFPSSAKTNVGGIIPSNFFMDSAACGECHRDIYAQWKSSVHHFASFNNQFYRKSIEYMQSVVGTRPSKWCAGCHDHAVFFNGRFDRPIKDQIDTPEAHAGLACTSCHSISHVDGSMGNGGFTMEYPPLHELATSRAPGLRGLSHFLTYLNPEPHRRTFMKPFMRLDASEFCSSCHKVHLDVPVNGYRWFRGFNDYDNWQASGVSGQGARSFYYPAKASTCVDCHMPLTPSRDPGAHADGNVHSHRFAAANTAVPFVNHDAEQLQAAEEFLRSGFISVDIFAVSPVAEKSERAGMIRRAGEAPEAMTGFAVGEEAEQAGPSVIREVGPVSAPIDRAQPRLRPGSAARIDVVVRTRKVGHFFPGGTVDAFDVWLELQGCDADGRVIFWSGQVSDGGKGPVEEGAHFYRSYQLDAAGNPIDKRNAWQSRSLLYVRLIPPGAADTVHFRVRIPGDARGPLTFTARLNHRKFAHRYTQFAYAGEPKPGQDPALIGRDFNGLEYSFDAAHIPRNVSGEIKDRIPDLPITTVARAQVSIPLGDRKTPTVWTPAVERADRERWNDWGIGLLLQGHVKGAEYAFTQVTKADPDYADGWLNMARALIQEGETDASKPFLERARQADPSLARIDFFEALTEKADGDYPRALRSLAIVSSKYPRDRVVLNQIARILFLQRKYEDALRVLGRIRQVDPEDLQMHYTALLCYRGLGRKEEAVREEGLFRRFKADESAQALTAGRRMRNPDENNERQSIHEHGSVPLDRPVRPRQAAAPSAVAK